MIRHIVMWKLTATDEAQKAADAEAIRDALESLVPEIDEIVSLTVSRNSVDIDGNWDLVLVGDYVDADGLRTYIEHPLHQAAVSVVRPRVEARGAVDFEV